MTPDMATEIRAKAFKVYDQARALEHAIRDLDAYVSTYWLPIPDDIPPFWLSGDALKASTLTSSAMHNLYMTAARRLPEKS